MQISSSKDPSRSRGKASGKTAATKVTKSKTEAKADTLRLRAKQPAETSSLSGDVAAMIATAAYYRAAQRGFEPGHELDDWLHAEQLVRAQIPS